MKDTNTIKGFPNPLASAEEKKSEKYGLRYGKAIWDEVNGKTKKFYNQRDKITELRNYAVDSIDIERFKDKYSIDNGNKSYLNLNFKIGTVIPNYVNISSNKLTDRGYEIDLESIDKDSSDEWDKEIKARIGKMKVRKAAMKMAEQGQMNPTVDRLLAETEDAPTSEDEAIFDMDMNFKTEAEEAYEAALSYVWQNNRIKEVEKIIARDLHVIQKAGAMCYLDENGDIKIDWVDQKNLVSGYCTHPDFSDCRYIGVVKEMNLADLKAMAGDKFTDAQYHQMASNWNRELGNDKLTLGSYTDSDFTFEEISDFKVLVLYFQYKGVDRDTYRKKEKNGSEFYDRVDDTYKDEYESNGKKHKKKGVKKIDIKDCVNIYQGYYIANTNYIFNYEKKPNMTRKVEDGTYSSDTDFDIIEYAPHMQDMITKGMVERMLPHVEAMIDVDLKIQHFVAKSRPAGVALDVAALQGISSGTGGKFVTYDMAQQIYDQVGNLYYNSMRADGSPSIAANSTPIQDLPNGLARGLQELLALQNYHLSQIYQITGINPAIDGTMPSKGTLVGAIEAQQASYNSATGHLFDGYVNIMQRLAERCVLLIQNQMDMGVKVRGYKKGIGGARTMVLKSTKNIRMSELGIAVRFKPTAGDKQNIKDYLAHALKTDQISVGDAMRAEEMLNVSTKETSEFITRKVEAYAKMKSDFAMQQSQGQAEAMQAAEQAKSNGEIAIIDMRVKADLAKINAQKEADMEVMMLEYKLKGELESIKGDVKEDLIEKSADVEASQPSGEGEGFKIQDAARKMKENVGGSGVRVNTKPSDDVSQGMSASLR